MTKEIADRLREFLRLTRHLTRTLADIPFKFGGSANAFGVTLRQVEAKLPFISLFNQRKRSCRRRREDAGLPVRHELID